MKLYFLNILFVLFFTNSVLSQHFKIMSYNIRYDNNWDKAHSWQDRKTKVIGIIKNYKPVIFGVQEAVLNQVEFIDKKLAKYKYIGVGRDNGETKGEFSPLFYNTVKFELLKKGTFWLSKTPEKPSRGWDAALNRICTYGLFKSHKTGGKFWVFNTHFDHKGAVARLNSAQLIIKKINTLNKDKYPVILMGDFNDTPDKAPIKLLKKYFKDAMAISKRPFRGPLGTFNGFTDAHTKTKIDYFFCDKVVVFKYSHINDMRPHNKFPSDHFPIFMRFKVKK